MATTTTKPKNPGREQRRATPSAQAHTPDLSKFYNHKLPEMHPGLFEFHLDLLRKALPPFSLDTMVDTFSWVDEQTVLTGSLTARRPIPDDPTSLPIARGQLVRCRVKWADNKTYELWTMRVKAPQVALDTATVSITLEDDMALLEAGSQDWIFRKTKQRPHGYRADEIARAVARRIGLKVGKLAKGTKRQSLVKRKAAPLDAIRAAYQSEKDASGQSYVIRLRNGRLEVVSLQRNPLLYTLAEQIQTAALTLKDGSKQPTTVLTGHGRIGHGKTSRKISFTATNRQLVNLLGHVRDTKDYGQVSSPKDLRDQVKRDLADGLKLNDTIDITHQGIPFIVRGDGVEVDLPKEGYSKSDAFVFVTSANHTVQAGVYTAEFQMNAKDPFLAADTAAKAKAQRKTKRTQRGRASTGTASGDTGGESG